MTPQPSQRAHERTRLFVTATLSSASTTGSVRLRDISPTGALIEADLLPAIDERVTIRRGELRAVGQVVRTQGKQAGIRFERPIETTDWLPNKAHWQLHVDLVLETMKPRFEGGPPVHSAASSSNRAHAKALPSSPETRDEMEGIADMLDALADMMSGDPVIIANYLDKLQVLDIASQKLRKLGRSF